MTNMWHNITIIYSDDGKVKSDYFRTRTVEEAIREFRIFSEDPIVQISMDDDLYIDVKYEIINIKRG